MDKSETDERRLIDLESRSAFQEETLRQLNDALVGQQGRIDRLEATLQAVVTQLRQERSHDDRSQDAPDDERPPHY